MINRTAATLRRWNHQKDAEGRHRRRRRRAHMIVYPHGAMAGEEDGQEVAVWKTKKRTLKAMPEAPALLSQRVVKYWHQRYSLFSKYDEGINMDEEGWFSVTPEEVAVRQAELCGRVGASVVIDGFSGVGGNSIQFAKRGYYVVALEIDPRKVKFARHNAQIYGVQDNIDFVVGDFLRLAPTLKGDVVFLSPPWGGPDYRTIKNFTLDFLKPEDGYSIFRIAQRISPNIIMFLPRNVDRNQLEELCWLSSPPLNVEIEDSYVNGHLKGTTVCFGDLASGSFT